MPVRAAGRAIVAAAFLIGASASLAQSPQRSSRDQKPRVAAMIAMDELAAWQPEWLRPIDAHGRPLSLAAAPQTLDVVAVSPRALTAAVSR